MSVPNQTPYNIHTANGVATVYAYEFLLLDAADMQVSVNGSIVSSGYTVNGIGNANGGDVTFITPPAKGATVMLLRDVPLYRITNYQDNGDLRATTINLDFDRIWMVLQGQDLFGSLALRRPWFNYDYYAGQGYRIADIADPVGNQDAATKHYVDGVALNRALRVPEPYIAPLPTVPGRRNKIQAYDDLGNPKMVLPESGSAADVMLELAAPDGLKYIGTCPDISTLRTIEPERNQQKIFVDFHTTGMKPTASGDTGGGLFVADFTDSTSADDNGMVIVTAGGKRWKRDLQGKGYVTPRMFGAWMDAPYIDGSTIQGTPYPKAPSMGGVDLTGVTNDGLALNKAYLTKLPVFIDQPIYIGNTQIDISQFRWEGITLNIKGDNPRQSLIYTSGNGGFYMSAWGHNLQIENIGFRNADSEYAGCPLLLSGPSTTYGGGKNWKLTNIDFYHYKFALPSCPFVSVIQNIFMYDCTYGFAIWGTSTDISAIWASQCDVGYLWGAVIDRETYEPVNAPGPLMYVAANNIAADGCSLPHKFYGFRSLSIKGMGIEGINGTHALDFSDYNEEDDQSVATVENISCWIQDPSGATVTHFVELPANEQKGPVNFRFESGCVKAYKGISFLKNIADPTNQYQCRGFTFGENFIFVKNTIGSSISDFDVRGINYHGKYYGEHTGIGFRTGSDGVVLSAKHQATNATYTQVLTEDATVLVPYGRNIDILISTIGEEASYTGGVFIAAELKIMPINQNGLGGTGETGGVILVSVSAKDQATLASSNVWSNMIDGSKNLTGITTSKYNNGSQTFLRVSFAAAAFSQAIVHMKITSQGLMHYYDKRWRLTA